jgi:sec-independent protein translocase protein TatA
MGFGGISIWSLLLILGIVILIFGTKKLRNVGGDLGGAIKSFKKSVKEEDVASDKPETEDQVLEGKVKEEDKV